MQATISLWEIGDKGRWVHEFSIGQESHRVMGGKGRQSSKGAVPRDLHKEICRVRQAYYNLSQVELAVPMWAVQYFPEGIDDPCFRLPTQPKAVDGWGGTGEASEPHFLVEGEGGAGVARNRT